MTIPAPSHEFLSMTDTSISKALGDLDVRNPVVIELGRLMVGYVSALRGHTSPDGAALQNFLAFQPQSPIEAAAKRLTECVLCDGFVRDYKASRSAPAR
jgi:hypothetical protein